MIGTLMAPLPPSGASVPEPPPELGAMVVEFSPSIGAVVVGSVPVTVSLLVSKGVGAGVTIPPPTVAVGTAVLLAPPATETVGAALVEDATGAEDGAETPAAATATVMLWPAAQ